MVNIKKSVIVILLLIFFIPISAQEKENYDQYYNDKITILKKSFSDKLGELRYSIRSKKLYKRDRIYVSIDNTAQLYKIISGELNGGFEGKYYFRKENADLYYNIFNNEEFSYYEKQIIESRLPFKKSDIETDSVFVYNKNRDKAIFNSEGFSMVSENSVEHISIPLFTRNHKYAIVRRLNVHEDECIIYEYKNNDWSEIKYFRYIKFL